MARLQLDPGAKLGAANSGQPVKTHTCMRNLQLSFVRLFQTGNGAGPEKNGSSGSAPSHVSVSNTTVPPKFRSTGFVRALGISSGFATGLIAVGMAAGWLSFDRDTRRISVVFPSFTTANTLKKEKSAARKNNITRPIPDSLQKPLLEDMHEYNANKESLSRATRMMLTSEVSQPGNIGVDSEQPMQGDWVIPPQFDIPMHNVSTSCSKYGCSFRLRFKEYWRGDREYIMGKVRFDPDNEKQAWGVLPIFSQLVGNGGSARPYFVSVKVTTNDSGMEALRLDYYDENDERMLRTIWPRLEKKADKR